MTTRSLGPDVLGRLRGNEDALAWHLWNDASAIRGLCSADPRGRPSHTIVRELVRGIHRVVGPGRPDEFEVAAYGRRAERHGALCARRGVPLAALLTAYESCFGLTQVRLWTGAQPGDESRLQQVTQRGARWLARIGERAADGYAAELDRCGRRREATRALASALLLGHRSELLARCAGVVLAPRYRIVVGICADSGDPWNHPPFADALAAARPVVLHCELDRDLVLLLGCPPDRQEDGRARGRSEEADAGLRALVADPGAVGIHWGTADPVPLSRLMAGARQARGTAELACAANLPTGAVNAPADVVVEALSLRDPVVRPFLEEIGELLAVDPDLMRTVETLYRTDLDRGRTADRLGIARRTLNSRLNRVQHLTGIGPTTSTGIQLLGLALAARRLRSAVHPEEAGLPA